MDFDYKTSEWIVLLLLEILGVAGRFSLIPHTPFLLIYLSCFLLTFSCSFVYSSLGLTAMAFVTGALGMWMPLFLYRAQVVQGIVPPCFQESCNSSNRWAVPVGAHTEIPHCAQSELVSKGGREDVTEHFLCRQWGVNVKLLPDIWDTPLCLCVYNHSVNWKDAASPI